MSLCHSLVCNQCCDCLYYVLLFYGVYIERGRESARTGSSSSSARASVPDWRSGKSKSRQDESKQWVAESAGKMVLWYLARVV
jgi:hypothetical protein